MSRVIRSFFQAMKMIKEDKVLLLLSLIPIIVGIGVYVALGSWLYTSFVPSGVEWVQDKLSLEWLGSFFSWIIKGCFLFYLEDWQTTLLSWLLVFLPLLLTT